MEPMGLDDILKGVERPALTPEPKAEAPAPTTEAKAEPAAAEPAKVAPEKPTSRRVQHRDKEQGAQGRERDAATGQYAPKTEAKEAPKEEPKIEAKVEPKAEAKEEFTPKEKAFLRAAEEERRKRQDLERQLAAATAAPKAAPAPTEKKTFWDDPEGALEAHRAEFQTAIQRTRLETSEAIARSRYPDFQDNLNQFIEISKDNPALYHQMMRSPDPAEFAYRTGKNHKEVAEAGSIDAIKKRVEDETRVKVEAEVREKVKKEEEARRATVAALPGSLSNVTGTSSNSARPSWGGPTSLDNILKP